MPFNNEEIKNFLLDFWVAGTTASVTKTITAPFDRIKLILQNQHSVLQVLTGKIKTYRGVIDCLIRLPKEQGYKSLWRGNGINIIRYFPTQALNFAFHDFFKARLHDVEGKRKDNALKIFTVEFVAGGLAGAFTTIIVYPLEFCQTRVSVDVGNDKTILKPKNKNPAGIEREFNGLHDCLRKIFKAEGYPGLYRGFILAVTGTSLYRAFYFGLFDGMKRLWAKEPISTRLEVTKPPLYVAVLMAQIVTCVSGICSYPLDTVGRRLMMEAGRPKDLRLFKNSWEAIKYIYTREGGVLAFYKGLGANCLRGFSGALVLVFYDEVLHITKQKMM